MRSSDRPVRHAPLRIGIQTWGSEGDVRPFLALGHGLARRGHDVDVLITELDNRRYDTLAASLGLHVRTVATPVVADAARLEEIGRRMVAAPNPLLQARVIVSELLNPVVDAIYEASLDLARRNDLVVRHFFLHPAGAAAEQAGTPQVAVVLAHSMIPTRHRPPDGVPRIGAWANPFWWRLARTTANLTFLRDVNALRRRAGLPLQRDLMRETWQSDRLTLVAVSQTLCDRPSDWPASYRVTGFLSMPFDAAGELPAEVNAFLADGPAPVFFGFGSLMPKAGGLLLETVEVFRQAAAAAGCRAIVQVPPAATGMVRSSNDLLIVGAVPHALVYGRCALVVHHGGAGTTQSALQAGRPSVVVPHAADQFFWAHELERLGVAPKPLGRRRLAPSRLAERLRVVLGDPACAARAAGLGERLRLEDGVGEAVRAIENLVIVRRGDVAT
jgi:sterol 3beta-glucosyltransferase